MTFTTMIPVPTWGTVGLFEIIWTAAGLLAMTLSIVGFRSALRDIASLPQLRQSKQVHDTHYRMIAIVAYGHKRNELLRVGMGSIISASGAFAASQPNPLGGHLTVSGFVTICGLVVLALLIATRSALDLRQRRELEEIAKTRTPRYTGEA